MKHQTIPSAAWAPHTLVAQNSNDPLAKPREVRPLFYDGQLSINLLAPDTLFALTLDRAHDNIALGWQFLRMGDYEGVRYALSHADDVLEVLRQEHQYRPCRKRMGNLRREIRALREALAEKNPSPFAALRYSLRRAWRKLMLQAWQLRAGN